MLTLQRAYPEVVPIRSSSLFLASAQLCVLIVFHPALLHAQVWTERELSCPVTTRPSSVFVPPKPFPAKPDASDAFFIGSEKLWTVLSDRPWKGEHVADGIRVKVPWFAASLTREEQLHPRISISGRRLNGSGKIQVEGPDNARVADYYFFASTLVFSTDGCWQIIVKRKDVQLSIVVSLTR